MKTKLLLAAIISFIFINSYGQTPDLLVTNSSANDTVRICVGAGVTSYAPALSLNTNFNTGFLPAGFTSTAGPMFGNPCGPGLDGTPYFWIGDISCFPRQITAAPVFVDSSSVICFEMKFASQGDVSPCEGPDEMDEGVSLQYSIDGLTWNTITYFAPDGVQYPTNAWIGGSTVGGGQGTPFNVWNQYCYSVPSAATGSHTFFRWFQDQVTSSGYDHWGLDNISINGTGANETYDWYFNGISLNSYTNNYSFVPAEEGWLTCIFVSDTFSVTDSVFLSIDTNCFAISGIVYNEVIPNCIPDSSELKRKLAKVQLLQNGTLLRTCWTDSAGHYIFNELVAGTYEVKYGGNLSCLTSTCPPSGNYFISEDSAHVDFGLGYSANINYGINIWSLVQQDSIRLNVGVSNECNPLWENCSIQIIFNDSILDFSSYNAPDWTLVSSSTDTLNFYADIDSYGYFNTGAYLFFQFDSLDSSEVCFTGLVTPVSADTDSSDNVDYFCDELVQGWPWDPNFKAVFPRGEGPEGYIDPDLTMYYTIHFQNTGTAPANHVYLLDTISQHLEIGSVEILDYSHYVEASMNWNVLRFDFPNINLPDSNANEPESHGYITYSIRQKPGLLPLTEITNSAGIFFDSNPAVITNTTLNTIKNPMGINILAEEGVVVYPNPANTRLCIQTEEGFTTVKIFDSQGRLTFTKSNFIEEEVIDVSGFPEGIYLLSTTNGRKIITKKFVIAR